MQKKKRPTKDKELAEFLKAAKNINQNKPGRFIVFANVDFKGVGEPGWGEKAAKQLEEDVKNGCELSTG